MTNAERWLLGLLSASLALGQVAFLIVFLAVLGKVVPFPGSGAMFLVLFVGAGLHIAALIVLPFATSERVPPEQRFAWQRAVRAFGPFALFAIWWQHIRPSASGAA
jgi:hypothetical protein